MKFSKPYSQVIDPDEMFELQNAQDSDRLLMTGVVPANSGGSTFITNVSQLGHFFCKFITGTFETLSIPVAAIVDDGVTYLSGQLLDSTRPLFSARIPFDHFLCPGRRKSANSTTVLVDPVGNVLFYPIEVGHLFPVNANITMIVASTSNTPLSFEITFHGLRIFSTAAADALRRKARERQ